MAEATKDSVGSGDLIFLEAGVRAPEDIAKPPANSKKSLVRVWVVFLAGPVLAATILVGRLAWAQRDNPRFINYAVALIPVLISILIAFVPDLRRAHMAWRVAVIGIGIAWSILLWRQQLLSDRQQADELATVLKGANKQTEEQVGMVRDDLKDARTHSDQSIGAVRSDFKTSIVGVTDLISKTETDLNAAISKVGKPDPPEQPKLQFSLWGDGKIFPLTTFALRPDKDGVFSVDFNFANIAHVAASKIDFWVYVCDTCVFGKEPSGFDKPSGLDEHARHRLIPGFINAGAFFEKQTIAIKTTMPVPWFDLAFRYSCESCGGVSEGQTVRILALPAE
jgi:hypothetical protein